MKPFNKTLIAAALIAATGAANAAGLVTSVGGGNELFLSVYDQGAAIVDPSTGATTYHGETYNLNLHVTFDQLKAGATTALAAFEGAGKSLSTDANWTGFTNFMSSNPGTVRYLVAADNYNLPQNSGSEIFVSGSTPLMPDTFNTPLKIADIAIDQHAAQIAAGAGANDSSMIADTGTQKTGQFNESTGVQASALWGGWGQGSFDPTQAYGTAVNFYQGGVSQVTAPGRGGGSIDVFTSSDVTNLGQFLLTGNTLTFSAAGVSAVPLPAAVWMFGAGLMGLLRITRRKSVEI
jgi:hypothetical protein